MKMDRQGGRRFFWFVAAGHVQFVNKQWVNGCKIVLYIDIHIMRRVILWKKMQKSFCKKY